MWQCRQIEVLLATILESLDLFFAATRNGRDRLRWSLYPPCLASARATFVSRQVQMNYCSM